MLEPEVVPEFPGRLPPEQPETANDAAHHHCVHLPSAEAAFLAAAASPLMRKMLPYWLERQRVKTSADNQLNHTQLAPLLARRANLGLPSSNGVANLVWPEPH